MDRRSMDGNPEIEKSGAYKTNAGFAVRDRV
jgi:hypothetical protein